MVSTPRQASLIGERLDEQMLPNVVGLLPLGHLPKRVVRQLPRRNDAKDLGHEVVVGQQLVDAPQVQTLGIGGVAAAAEGRAKRGRVKVRVKVPNGLIAHRGANGRLQRLMVPNGRAVARRGALRELVDSDH